MVAVNTPNHEGKYPHEARKTIKTGIMIICPVCGNKGELVVRRRKENYYAYAYHGYEGRKKVEHYIGKCPPPASPEFSDFVKELEEKRVVRLVLNLSEYQLLERLAAKEGLSLEQLVVKLLRDYENKKREEVLTKALQQSTPTPSQSRAHRDRRNTRRDRKGGEWQWWTNAKKS